MNQFIVYGLVLAGAFFAYLLFTQPQNALYYLEKIVMVVVKVLELIFRFLYALVNGIINLFKRR
jgi:hypothetical protein